MLRRTAKRGILQFLDDSSFIRYYLWKYRGWVGLGLIALVVVDVLEILPPLFLKTVVDITVEHRPVRLLAWVGVAYLLTSMLQALCRYGWRMYLIRSSVYAGRDLRSQFTEHLFGLSVSFYDRSRMGDLMSLATQDVDAVRMAMGTGLLVFADALFYLVTLPIAMMLLSPGLTLLVCLPLPLVPFIVMRNEKEVHQRFEEVQECFGKISTLVQENLNGIRVVKTFACEDTQLKRVKEVGEEYARLNLRLARLQSSMGPTLDFIMNIGMIVLLAVGGSLMIKNGEAAITLGTFVAFQRYVQKMIWPMAALGMAVNYYQRSVSSAGRLKSIFALTSDVENPTFPIVPSVRRGEIEFRNLSFTFPGSTKTVLSQMSFRVEAGERVALIGVLGSGKSTLLSLVPRLYPVSSGMLWIDGVDINQWPIEELRQHVGYVSQDVFLFSETILENVGFGLHERMGELDSINRVSEAAQMASMHEEISRLASSYRTRLEERGMNLSGGQKQRLTIARALAKKPSILVLDDALSSVDVHTEDQILTALRNRTERNTELISAHRISTIQDADRILVLKEGQVAQMGTHAQLLKVRGGEYWKFYEQQKRAEDLERDPRV